MFPAVACAAPAKIAINSFGVHRLGATPASNALERVADCAKLQEWLGHANIATTRIYDHRRHRMAKLKLRSMTIKPIPAGYRRNVLTSSATPSGVATVIKPTGRISVSVLRRKAYGAWLTASAGKLIDACCY
ncbi:site-specific integrase [Paraburkholderia hospita]|jgi:hypothetical protein|uniref:site-specific integrase n=1 Tax=Paraburkholderia hospita TaxID=169430 RepID=UPI0002EF764E|nr:site-specific integrase [Paraburkholderia hospita]OUL85163.1 hypothetical protein CA602_18665 [Paraburkholderia hospita]OUL93341.1 hypothetical protein CA601_10225 [Paraburkholderia hospita]OUL97357.1 hypothetical protein CA603_03070 [Paraburkholderia hospita]